VAERWGKNKSIRHDFELVHGITRLTPAALKQQATEEIESGWAKTGVQ
jgi:hypothetical protein